MSIDFDGTGDWLKITTTSILTAPPLTMACWFNSDDITVTRCLMSIDDASGGFNQFSLQIAGAVAGDPVRCVTQNFLTVANADTTSGYSASTWQHACGVIASSTDRRAFLNGGSKGTNATSVTDPPGMDAFSIGDLGVADTLPMAGLIAHAGLWNIALADADVALLAGGAHPLFVRPDSLVAYWPMFDERASQVDWIGRVSLTVNGNPTKGASDPYIGFPPFMRARAWPKISVGPVTTNLTLTADATGTVTLIRSASLSKSTTVIGISGDVLSVGKLLSASATSTAVISFTHVINLTLAAAATVVAAMTKTAGKLANAASSVVASIVKGTSLNETVTVVGVAGQVMSIGKTLLASAVAAPTVVVTFIPFAPVVAAGRFLLQGLVRGVGKIGRGN